MQVDLFGLECDGCKDGDAQNNDAQDRPPPFKTKAEGAEPAPIDPAKLTEARTKQQQAAKLAEDLPDSLQHKTVAVNGGNHLTPVIT